ncbi:MAG: DUF2066 domain-containing protein, partial [Mesorhizobium sp.]
MAGVSRLVAGLAGLLFLGVAPAAAEAASELYLAQTIVTGTGEANREIGFKDCLDKVLVKVSGDQRLTQKPEMLALRNKAAGHACLARRGSERLPAGRGSGRIGQSRPPYCA